MAPAAREVRQNIKPKSQKKALPRKYQKKNSKKNTLPKEAMKTEKEN
jgi:hypothetical protein